jgi:siroheme synthase (precorrin-2 oxidase/ferrochelatase)
MSSLFPGLPVFLDLVGRSVVIAAGGAAADTLARDCLASGAGVIHIHPSLTAHGAPGFQALARRWRAADFRNAALVAVGGDERRISQARASAKAARAVFMVLDGGPGSDLAPAETSARGPLTVGVSMIGLPAGLAAALRARLAAAAPPGLTGFLEAAAQFSAPSGWTSATQAQFWSEALAAASVARPECWRDWLSARAQHAAAGARA